jgi:transcriptional regulator of arginine metabolism
VTAAESTQTMHLAGHSPTGKRTRQRTVLELVGRESITSQAELAEELRRRGFPVTQATVSRDIAELGLAKIPRGDRHVYVAPSDIAAGDTSNGSRASAPTRQRGDERLRRILTDVPLTVGRSGLILVLTGSPGTAGIVAQAIDESGRTEPEGTLAGDNTLLVLFADEVRLESWIAWFEGLLPVGAPRRPATPSPSPITEAHA